MSATRAHVTDHLAAVLTTPHHHDTADNLTCAVARYRSLPEFGPILHVRHVIDQYRHAGRARPNHCAPEVIETGSLTESAKDALLVSVLQVSAGGDRVARPDGLDDVVQREAECDEPLGRNRDLHLAHKSAESIDLRDTTNAA